MLPRLRNAFSLLTKSLLDVHRVFLLHGEDVSQLLRETIEVQLLHLLDPDGVPRDGIVLARQVQALIRYRPISLPDLSPRSKALMFPSVVSAMLGSASEVK